jgi:hypothetical protein
MSCPELALRLTNNYYTEIDFNTTDGSLNEYLNHNGLFLTMCIGQTIFPRIFGGPCKMGFRSNHISASWIRNSDTGFRIFGPPEPNDIPIGLILDPNVAQIDCLYPVDGVTETRMNRGCGMQPDSPGGPNNFWRSVERYQIVEYKNDVFGKDTKWSDIDCNDFIRYFGPGNFALNNTDCSIAVTGGIPFSFESAPKLVYETWSNIMGHPVCNITRAWVDPTFTTEDTILYMGSCVWKPSDWVGMIDTMVNIASEYPHVHFWNEIIVAKPKAVADIVQAVFILDGLHDYYEAAKMEANKMRKPLLTLHPPDPTTGQSLSFTCDESTSTQ